MRQQWPDDILHFRMQCSDDGNPCSFGFWIRAQAAQTLDHNSFSIAIYDWQIFHMPTFLDCMHGAASFVACHIERRGAVPFRYSELFAPNAGAQGEGNSMAVACGLYLAPAISSRGGGSRLRLCGLPDRFITNQSKLSGYGVQQLQFAADDLAAYPARLQAAWGTPTELVTVETRRSGLPLNPAQFVPTVVIRPSLRIDTLARRLRSAGGFASP